MMESVKAESSDPDVHVQHPPTTMPRFLSLAGKGTRERESDAKTAGVRRPSEDLKVTGSVSDLKSKWEMLAQQASTPSAPSTPISSRRRSFLLTLNEKTPVAPFSGPLSKNAAARVVEKLALQSSVVMVRTGFSPSSGGSPSHCLLVDAGPAAGKGQPDTIPNDAQAHALETDTDGEEASPPQTPVTQPSPIMSPLSPVHWQPRLNDDRDRSGRPPCDSGICRDNADTVPDNSAPSPPVAEAKRGQINKEMQPLSSLPRAALGVSHVSVVGSRTCQVPSVATKQTGIPSARMDLFSYKFPFTCDFWCRFQNAAPG